jgi:hypothetical protein
VRSHLQGQVVISFPETSVTANLRCVTSQKSEDLIHRLIFIMEIHNVFGDVAINCLIITYTILSH